MRGAAALVVATSGDLIGQIREENYVRGENGSLERFRNTSAHS
jgi:hypothetical protein